MALVNTITVNDGATPAVPRTFTVYDRDGTRSHFRTSASTLVKGALEFIHRVTIAQSKQAANRAQMTFTFPLEGIVNGETVVTSVSTAVVDLNFAQGLNIEQRTAFYGLVVNALNNADIKAQSVAISPVS